MKPVRVTAPAPLLTLAEAKQHLRVDHFDDDALIVSLLAGAVDHFDGYSGIMGRCLVSQNWRQPAQEWAAVIRLPFTNLSGVSVKYRDVANADQTVAAANYDLVEDHLSPAIVFKGSFAWPDLATSIAPISIDFTAGYGAPADVPEGVKACVKLLLSYLYENRGGGEIEMPAAIHMLASNFRLRRL
jgi:uncharacterized phiE125 gp8 family phage protein